MPVNMQHKTLTLSQWVTVAELAIDTLTNGRTVQMDGEPDAPGSTRYRQLLTQEEATATLDLLERIGDWQSYFLVDGESAANELCGVDIPAGLPFSIERVGP